MLPKSRTVDFTITTADTYQIVSALNTEIPSGYAMRVTATSWRGSDTPASGIRILTSADPSSVHNADTVALNESPVTQQIGLSTTGAIKNIGAVSIYAYIAVKYPSTGTYKVTIFYDMVTGTRTN